MKPKWTTLDVEKLLNKKRKQEQTMMANVGAFTGAFGPVLQRYPFPVSVDSDEDDDRNDLDHNYADVLYRIRGS